jgi:hypothetical protein
LKSTLRRTTAAHASIHSTSNLSPAATASVDQDALHVRNLSTELTELCAAIPQVVAYRVTRMAIGSVRHDPADEAEFIGMGTEKMATLGESWSAMTVELCRLNQRFADALLKAVVEPGAGSIPALLRSTPGGRDAVLSIFRSGIQPIHRRTLENVRRLAAHAVAP